ncbi:reverse transcriptase domain-containing protein [Tanacetum coccineum]
MHIEKADGLWNTVWKQKPQFKQNETRLIVELKAAFKQMKRLIVELPTLTAPMEKEELIVYLPSTSNSRYHGPANQADFIVEQLEDDSLVAPMEVEEELPDPWTLFTDGSSYVDGSGAGLILTNSEGTKFTYALRFEFNETNNEAGELVERANRSLGEGMKARLDKGRKDWMEEIPHVLWAHRTMIKSSNEDTLFSLTYEMEAMILAEISMPTLRTTEIDMVQIDEALKLNLDLLEEKREHEAIRKAIRKAKMEKYYNSKVHNANLKLGDLVYRNNDVSQLPKIRISESRP